MRHSQRLLLPLFMACCLQITAAGDQTTKDEAKEVRTKLVDTVKVVFPKKGYSFTLDQVAKGIKIQYQISIAQDLPGVIPTPFPPSYTEPAGASGMHPRETISGQGQRYCIADSGLALEPDQGKVRVLQKGMHQHQFEWDGRNWFGPSDFCNPKGKPFPVGEYELTVELQGFLKTKAGKVPYHISGKTKLILKK